MSTETKSAGIKAKVAEGLKDSGEKVAQGVADALVEKEMNRRKSLVTDALSKLEDLEKEGRKIKPDNSIYNADETVAQEGWTKAALENKKKHEAKVTKLEKAIDNALNNGDYKALEEAVK